MKIQNLSCILFLISCIPHHKEARNSGVNKKTVNITYE